MLTDRGNRARTLSVARVSAGVQHARGALSSPLRSDREIEKFRCRLISTSRRYDVRRHFQADAYERSSSTKPARRFYGAGFLSQRALGREFTFKTVGETAALGFVGWPGIRLYDGTLRYLARGRAISCARST